MSPAQLTKLIEIQSDGKLGTLLERFAYIRREVADHDRYALTYARLDAENIGSAAATLLGVDSDDAAAQALELIAPDPFAQAGAELIEEMHRELFGPQSEPETATAATTKPPRKW